MPGTSALGKRTPQTRPDDSRYAGISVPRRLHMWARNFRQPLPRFGVMSTPPTVTFGGNNSATSASYTNGQTMYGSTSDRMVLTGSIFTNVVGAGSFTYPQPNHITNTDGTTNGGNSPLRARFRTDAQSIEFCFQDSRAAQFNLIVDGQYIARDRTAVFGNTGNYRYIRVDFGADAITYGLVGANWNVVTAGTGYAVGDIVTLNGGTGGAGGTPATIKIAGINAGGAVSTYDVVNKGAYTSQPSTKLSQVSTTGAGTGLEVGASFFSRDHSVRKMRHVELVWSSPANFMGIVVGTTDAVIPWPVDSTAPRLAFIGDSITNGTYLAYGGGHMAASIAQKLSMWDNLIISAQGGTGWNTPNGTAPAWSHANRVADFIRYDADVYIFMGSQNDGSASTALQNAVTSTVNQVLAAKPNALLVGVGPVVGGTAALSASIGAGWAAASDQKRVRYLDTVTPHAWLPLVADWTVTNDGNHLDQGGLDRYAEIASPYIGNAIKSMVQAAA